MIYSLIGITVGSLQVCTGPTTGPYVLSVGGSLSAHTRGSPWWGHWAWNIMLVQVPHSELPTVDRVGSIFQDILLDICIVLKRSRTKGLETISIF